MFGVPFNGPVGILGDTQTVINSTTDGQTNTMTAIYYHEPNQQTTNPKTKNNNKQNKQHKPKTMPKTTTNKTNNTNQEQCQTTKQLITNNKTRKHQKQNNKKSTQTHKHTRNKIMNPMDTTTSNNNKNDDTNNNDMDKLRQAIVRTKTMWQSTTKDFERMETTTSYSRKLLLV